MEREEREEEEERGKGEKRTEQKRGNKLSCGAGGGESAFLSFRVTDVDVIQNASATDCNKDVYWKYLRYCQFIAAYACLHSIPKLVVVHPSLQNHVSQCSVRNSIRSRAYLVIRLGRITEPEVRRQSNHIVWVIVDRRCMDLRNQCLFV